MYANWCSLSITCVVIDAKICTKTSLPSSIYNRFHLNSHVPFYNSRASNNLHIKCITNNQGKKSLQCQGSVLWNSLPQYLRNISSPNQFKREAKEYLLVTHFNPQLKVIDVTAVLCSTVVLMFP